MQAMSSTDGPTSDDASLGPHHTRLIRGIAAGTFATFVALFSHVAGGGHAPSLLGVGLPLLLAVFVCVVLGGRKLSLVRLTTSVGISQTAFHWVFAAAAASVPGAGRATAQAAAAADPHAHHHVGGVPSDFAAAVSSGGATAGALSGHAVHSGTAMMLAHVVAAVVTIAVLYRSEVVLKSLLGLLRMLAAAFAPLCRVLAPAVITAGRRPLMGEGCEVHTPAPLGVVRSVRVDRGPPVRTPAFA